MATEPITVEELETELRALVLRYINSLSSTAFKWEQVATVRLEAQGEGLSVMYDKNARDGMPTLVLSLTPKR